MRESICVRPRSTRPPRSWSDSPSPRRGPTSWAARRRCSGQSSPANDWCVFPLYVIFVRAGTSVQLVCVIRDVTQPPSFIFWWVLWELFVPDPDSRNEPLLPQLYKISGQQNLLSSLIILFHCLPSDGNHDQNNFFPFHFPSFINKILHI